jgi:hypothetical protein
MSHLVAVATYPATCGVQVRCGARQSIPSTNIDSCAGLSVTTPSLVIGHTKRGMYTRRLDSVLPGSAQRGQTRDLPASGAVLLHVMWPRQEVSTSHNGAARVAFEGIETLGPCAI